MDSTSTFFYWCLVSILWFSDKSISACSAPSRVWNFLSLIRRASFSNSSRHSDSRRSAASSDRSSNATESVAYSSTMRKSIEMETDTHKRFIFTGFLIWYTILSVCLIIIFILGKSNSEALKGDLLSVNQVHWIEYVFYCFPLLMLINIYIYIYMLILILFNIVSFCVKLVN